jgi:hypothetical protein
MRHTRHSTILGTAFFATVALWPVGAQASAIPNSGMHVAHAAIPSDRTPYQVGYDQGRSEGYAAGESRAFSQCSWTWDRPPEKEGAYGVGYKEGYDIGFRRGYQDSFAKNCRPA